MTRWLRAPGRGLRRSTMGALAFSVQDERLGSPRLGCDGVADFKPGPFFSGAHLAPVRAAMTSFRARASQGRGRSGTTCGRSCSRSGERACRPLRRSSLDVGIHTSLCHLRELWRNRLCIIDDLFGAVLRREAFVVLLHAHSHWNSQPSRSGWPPRLPRGATSGQRSRRLLVPGRTRGSSCAGLPFDRRAGGRASSQTGSQVSAELEVKAHLRC
jgi:hypothetical protein